MTDPSCPALPRLPERAPESHKGHYGRALLVGGSRGMSGAIALAGMAALRGGAGLVKLAVPDCCLDTVAGFEPSYMTVPLADDPAGRIALPAKDQIDELARAATCLACGPGLGRSDQLGELVSWLYQSLPQPLVLDADGLNALSHRPEPLADPGGPRILTPHPGEFQRLTGGQSLTADQAVVRAEQLADHYQVVIILKQHRTLVTDGKRSVRNPTGNPGLATGGTGDVLTGVLTALLCQGLSPIEAAQLGSYVHGLAGDLAVEQLGQVALIASDLLRFLPPAFQQLSQAGSG